MTELDTITDIVLRYSPKAKYLTKDDINSRSRELNIKNTRFIIWKLARALTTYSSPAIAYHVGKKNHATLLHGVKTVTSYIDTYPKDAEEYEYLLDLCKREINKDYTILIDRYTAIVTDYIDIFAKKQDLVFEYWIADRIGEVAVFGDFSFNFTEILQDVNSNQPSGLILKWYYDSIDNSDFTINYSSYCMGLRFEQLKK